MIDIRNLSFSYPSDSQKEIFSGFSFELPGRGFTHLAGKNGSGKSTLIGLIGGVLKPSGGEILINQQAISNLTAQQAARLRSIAPQQRNFDLAFKVSEILNFVREENRATHFERVLEALDAVLGELAGGDHRVGVDGEFHRPAHVVEDQFVEIFVHHAALDHLQRRDAQALGDDVVGLGTVSAR